MIFARSLLALALTAISFVSFRSEAKLTRMQIESRIDDLVQRMTLEEKVLLLHGNPSAMETQAIARVGIPAMRLADGPLGVHVEKSTAFPASILVGASFNPDLMHEIGLAMGIETLAQGRDVLLGPCVNISREPRGGRNFESYGEDPYLNSQFAAAWVKGVQSRGVLASTKHYAVNDQEFERMTIDVRVDERTLHEIHLPAFVSALRAGTWTVMSAYNRINGHYASENGYLQDHLLKKTWGFPGLVVSDWSAVHSTVESANNGLDLEMPDGQNWGGGKLEQAVRSGLVKESTVDDKVRRILRAMMAHGAFDRKDADRPKTSVINQRAHQKLALKAAREGIVLLKNERGLLPVRASQKRVAVIGPNAAEARNNGGGSSRVQGFYDISPLEGLKNRAGTKLKFSFAQGARSFGEFDAVSPDALRPDGESGPAVVGLRGEYFNNPDLSGQPVVTRIDPTVNFNWYGNSPAEGVPQDGFSVRWTGKYRARVTGEHDIALRSDDGVRLYIDGKLEVDDWKAHPAFTNRLSKYLEAGREYDLRIEYFDGGSHAEVRLGITRDPEQVAKEQLAQAAMVAAQSDIALVFVGFSEWLEGEGFDRMSMHLPPGQDELVEVVAKANPNTVVVINGGGSTLMPWAGRVAAIVQSWYPGQEGGNAVADLLLGRANFSGKLPVSFYAKLEDVSSYGNYPGENGAVHYKEGLFVGYRHLDRARKQALFPFGHGLSYTKFSFAGTDVRVRSRKTSSPQVIVDVPVENIGRRAGSEVVQVYVRPLTPAVERPSQELKAFKKIHVRAGESAHTRLVLGAEAFAYYDVSAHAWRVDPGQYEIRVGRSSRDIFYRERVRLEGASKHLKPARWGENLARRP